MKIAVIIWYTPDNYIACREIMADKDRLPLTYDAWQKKSEMQARNAIMEGRRLYRVPLAADAFLEWCRSRDMEPDVQARKAFAMEAMHNRHVAAPVKSAPAGPASGQRHLSLYENADLAARDSLNKARAVVDEPVPPQRFDDLRRLVHVAHDAMKQVLEEKAALKARLDVVESEASRLAEFNMNAARYVKVKISPDTYVYRDKSSARYGNAPSFCPDCFENKRISILQGHPFGVCRICNFQGDISWRAHV